MQALIAAETSSVSEADYNEDGDVFMDYPTSPGSPGRSLNGGLGAFKLPS
jgi:hypothetical protein